MAFHRQKLDMWPQKDHKVVLTLPMSCVCPSGGPCLTGKSSVWPPQVLLCSQMYPSCLPPRALSWALTFFLVVFEGGKVAVCEYRWFWDLLQSVFSGSSRSYRSLALWIKGLFFSDNSRQTPFDNWVCAAVSGHLWCLLCSLYEVAYLVKTPTFTIVLLQYSSPAAWGSAVSFSYLLWAESCSGPRDSCSVRVLGRAVSRPDRLWKSCYVLFQMLHYLRNNCLS